MNRTQPRARGWIERVAGEYGRGRPVAVLFDYDGTLTPLARHPCLAELDPRTRRRLAALAALPDVRVGVVSGRALEDVRAMVGLGGVYYAGCGGLEIDLLGRTARYPTPGAALRLLDAVRDRLLDLVRSSPGTWLERKPAAVTLHYRGLLPLAAACFRYEAAALLAGAEGLRFRVVAEAIEVTPTGGWDRGAAVAAILEHVADAVAARPLPVYFGDAAHDAEAMVVTAHAGGVSVGVGADAPPHAGQRLADPSELGDCLDELAGRLAAGRGLPVEAKPPPDADDGPAGRDPGAAGGLLLLDPDPVARSEFADGMAELGWRVWEADTTERAVELLTAHGGAIDAALVDLHLPGLQGARALAEFGRSRPDLIRGFLAADVSPYTATAFGKLSDIPLFVKPLRAADTDTRVRGLLRTRRAAGGSGD